MHGVVIRILQNPISRLMVVHLDWLTPYQGPLRTSGIKEEAAGVFGE
jgi:hypothetical protein